MKIFRLSIIIAFLALAGCANLKTVYSTITDASVPEKTIVVAANAFDAVEVTATGYVKYCTPNPSPAGCTYAVIKQVESTVRAGRTARDALVGFMKSHPGQLGSKGIYDALVAATNTLSTLFNTTASAK